MRAILTGLPYPRTLLIQTIMRIRPDEDDQLAACRSPKISRNACWLEERGALVHLTLTLEGYARGAGP